MPMMSGLGKPSLKMNAGDQGDQDRADVDDQGGGAGVEVLLGGVEGDVVGAEPHDAVEDDQVQRLAGRQAAHAWASAMAVSAMEAATSRPRVSEPGENVSAIARMPTNADAHSSTVTSSAGRERSRFFTYSR